MPSSLQTFFFFQAEDGIRDLTVTGVQTCALPIWPSSKEPSRSEEVTPRSEPASILFSLKSERPNKSQAKRVVGNCCCSLRRPTLRIILSSTSILSASTRHSHLRIQF